MERMTSPWARAAAGANTLDRDAGIVLPTVYERTTALAIEHGAVNLGQGYPDAEGPQWLLDAAAQAIADPSVGPRNQYAPGLGLSVLREAVAAESGRRQGVVLDPVREVMITAGATEGIAATILAFAEPGSQVVCFTPHYDSYAAITALAGAELVGVPLRGADFRPDLDALTEAVSERTSLILVNTPHNPTGTVFTAQELESVVELAHRAGAVVMSDEVYEHLVLGDLTETGGPGHRSILSIPGAQDVAVALGSAGKSFSVTGWKVGWVTGSAVLVNRIRGVKQFLTFSSGPALQWAVAQGLQDDQGFFAHNRAQLAAGRDLLRQGLAELGLQPNSPAAGYFVLADISGVSEYDDVEFCRQLAERTGVAGIPVSSLVVQDSVPADDRLRKLVRLAFCKDPATIELALNRLGEQLSKLP